MLNFKGLRVIAETNNGDEYEIVLSPNPKSSGIFRKSSAAEIAGEIVECDALDFCDQIDVIVLSNADTRDILDYFREKEIEFDETINEILGDHDDNNNSECSKS